MAALTSQQRADVHGALMRDESDTFGALTKQDLRAAVDALDTFFDANAGAINNAFPAAAKASLTVPQKSRLVRYVIAKRFG